jgi:hypothetical protein
MVDIWLFTFTNATLVVTIKYCRIIVQGIFQMKHLFAYGCDHSKLREGLRSITFHFEIVPFFEFYFSQEREKIKLIE